MLVRIPKVLTKDEVAQCRSVLARTLWVDGKISAGYQSAQGKHNLEVPGDAPQNRLLRDLILRALARNELFNSASLPAKVWPPQFNRYDEGMSFDAHFDNAVLVVPGANLQVRSDLSATLFLSEPSEYDGGELTIEDSYGLHQVKLPAGDMVLYPASSLHRVPLITRGARWACFFWVQSMVKDDGQRRELYELDRAISETRGALGDDHPAAIALTHVYQNLLRRWTEI